VRLAAKLIGWHIDIKSEEEKRKEIENEMMLNTATLAPAEPAEPAAPVELAEAVETTVPPADEAPADAGDVADEGETDKE